MLQADSRRGRVRVKVEPDRLGSIQHSGGYIDTAPKQTDGEGKAPGHEKTVRHASGHISRRALHDCNLDRAAPRAESSQQIHCCLAVDLVEGLLASAVAKDHRRFRRST